MKGIRQIFFRMYVEILKMGKLTNQNESYPIESRFAIFNDLKTSKSK
jgi:hypothetical protein